MNEPLILSSPNGTNYYFENYKLINLLSFDQNKRICIENKNLVFYKENQLRGIKDFYGFVKVITLPNNLIGLRVTNDKHTELYTITNNNYKSVFSSNFTIATAKIENQNE